MRLESPAWWYEGRTPLAAWGLLPFSLLYGAAVQARFRLARPYRSKLPVICVGNFTLGGAGKTPVCLKIASLLSGIGLRPAFLTRGYGGAERGPVLVNSGHTAEAVGDEALLLAQAAATIVSRNRPAGARLIESLGADVIIMDDGFQNPAMAKDFSLIVVDGAAGVGSGRVFPLGPLRAPFAFQAAKADAILVVGAGDRGLAFREKLAAKPVIEAEIVPIIPPVLKGPLLAFCGIGRPAKFFDTLRKAGIDTIKCVSFPDHHPYSEADARGLLNEAERLSAGLVTTEKDHVRLRGNEGAIKGLAAAAVPLPISIRFGGDGEKTLMRLILARMGLAQP